MRVRIGFHDDGNGQVLHHGNFDLHFVRTVGRRSVERVSRGCKFLACVPGDVTRAWVELPVLWQWRREREVGTPRAVGRPFDGKRRGVHDLNGPVIKFDSMDVIELERIIDGVITVPTDGR